MRRIPIAVAAAIAALSIAACETAPKQIPEGAGAREMIQRAQEASDAGKEKTARAYYEAAKQRFPDDLAIVCACEYEIAFLDYKAGRYEVAAAGFGALLERYGSPDAAFLPQEYKILSERLLKKTNAILDERKAKAEKKKAKAKASAAPAAAE